MTSLYIVELQIKCAFYLLQIDLFTYYIIIKGFSIINEVDFIS